MFIKEKQYHFGSKKIKIDTLFEYQLKMFS
jgi:hypothetical protein